jgi:hypothetical protein
MWSSVFRNPFRQRTRIRAPPPPQPHSQSRSRFAAMSSASGAAAVLYASAVAQAVAQKKPDEAGLAKHHEAGGRGGFVNPWESFLNRSVWQIAGSMIWYRPIPGRW